MAEWNCSACTFLNPGTRNQCEICCTAKPGATIQTRSERETLWNQQAVALPSRFVQEDGQPKPAQYMPRQHRPSGDFGAQQQIGDAKPWLSEAARRQGQASAVNSSAPDRSPAVASKEQMDSWEFQTPWTSILAELDAEIEARKRPDWFKLNFCLSKLAKYLRSSGEQVANDEGGSTKEEKSDCDVAVTNFMTNRFDRSIAIFLDTADSDFSMARAWAELQQAWRKADDALIADNVSGTVEPKAQEKEIEGSTSVNINNRDNSTTSTAVLESGIGENASPSSGVEDGPIAQRMKRSFDMGIRAALDILFDQLRKEDYSKISLLGTLLDPKTRRYHHLSYMNPASKGGSSFSSTKTNVGAPHLHDLAIRESVSRGGFKVLLECAERKASANSETFLSLCQILAKNAKAFASEPLGKEGLIEFLSNMCNAQLDWTLNSLLDSNGRYQRFMDSLSQIAEACGNFESLKVTRTALSQYMRFVQSDKLRFRRFGIEQLGKLSSALVSGQKMTVDELTVLYKSFGVYEEVFGDRMDERVVSCSEALLKNSALDVEILDLLLANTNSRAVRKMLTTIVLQPTFTDELAQHMLVEASRAVIYLADYGSYKLIVAALASEPQVREGIIQKGPLAMEASLGALWTLLFCSSVQAPAHLISSATPPRMDSPARERDNNLARKRPLPRAGAFVNQALQHGHTPPLPPQQQHQHHHQQQQMPFVDNSHGLGQPTIERPRPEQETDPTAHTILGVLGLSVDRMEELMLAFARVAKDCNSPLKLRFAERALELVKRTHLANVNASAGLADTEAQDSMSMGFFAADDDDEALAPVSTEVCAMRPEETLVEADGLRVTTTAPDTVVVAYKVFRSLILSCTPADRPSMISELDQAWDLKSLLLSEFDAFLRLSPVRARLDKIEASIETQAANAASLAVTSAAAAAAFEGSIAQLTSEESRCADELQQHEKARLQTLSALVKNSDQRLTLTVDDMDRLWTSCCMPCYDANLGNYTTQETFMLWLRVTCFDAKYTCVEPEVCKYVLCELFQNRLDLVRVGPKTYHCLQAYFVFVNVSDKLLEAMDNEAVAEEFKFKTRPPPKGLEGPNLVNRRISVLLKTGNMAPGKITKHVSWSNLHKIEYVNGFSEEKDLARLDCWHLLPPLERAMAGHVVFKEVNVLDLAGRETVWTVALHSELPVVAVQAFNLLLGLYERVRLSMLEDGDSSDIPEVDLFVEHIFDELESFLGSSNRLDSHSGGHASTTSSPSSLHQVPGLMGSNMHNMGSGSAGGTGSGSGNSGSESQFGMDMSDYMDAGFLSRCIHFLHLYVKQLEKQLNMDENSPRKLAGLGAGDPILLHLETESESLQKQFSTDGFKTHSRASVHDVIFDLAAVAKCKPGEVTLRVPHDPLAQLSSAPHDVTMTTASCGNLILEELGLTGIAPVRVIVETPLPPVAKPVTKPATSTASDGFDVVQYNPAMIRGRLVSKHSSNAIDKEQDGTANSPGNTDSDDKKEEPPSEAGDTSEVTPLSYRSQRYFGFRDLCISKFASTPGGLVSCQSERVEMLLKLLDSCDREDRFEVAELIMNVPPFLRGLEHLLVGQSASAASKCAKLLQTFQETDIWRVVYILKLLGDLVLFPGTESCSSEHQAINSSSEEPCRLAVGGLELGRLLTAPEFFSYPDALPSVLRLFLMLIRQCGVPGMSKRGTKGSSTSNPLSVDSRFRPSSMLANNTVDTAFAISGSSDPSALFLALPMLARTIHLCVEAFVESGEALTKLDLVDETAEGILRVILVTRDELEKRKTCTSMHSCNCFGDFLGVPLDTPDMTGDAFADAESTRMRSTEPPALDQNLLGLRAPVCAVCLNTRRLAKASMHLLSALEVIVSNIEPIAKRILSRGSTCATIVRQLVLNCSVSEMRREVCNMLKRFSTQLPQHRVNLGQAIRDAERELESQRHSLSCDDFFSLFQTFVPDTSGGGEVTAEDHELVHRMVALVLEWPDRPTVEAAGTEEAEINLFVGFVQALARILETHTTLCQQAARTRLSRAKYGDDNLVRVLWNRFMVGESGSRPVCETVTSRKALTSLLCTLAGDDLLQASEVASLIEQFSSTTPTPLCEARRGRNLVPDWEFEPLPLGAYSSEFRGRNDTGHVGLRNRGSTCYINSLLQLLFHVPRFRRSILSAPVTPPQSLVSGTQTGSGSDSGSVGNSSGGGRSKTSESDETKIVVGWLCRCSGINDLNATNCHICNSAKAADAEMVTESFRPPPNGAAGNAENSNGESYNLEVLRQLQRTFRFLQDCNKGCFDPINFVEACAALKLQFPVTSQNDTSEFYDKLLDNLEASLQGTPFLEEMNDCFLGQQTKLKRCHTCGRVSTSREESFYRLELMTKDNSVEKNTLQECLDSFVAPEVMTGDNKVDCEQCQARMPCTFVSCMTNLPDYLFIHPKRFTFDLYTMQTVKLNHRITFPTHLDMFPYTRDGRAVEAERQARLMSSSGGSSSKLPGGGAAGGDSTASSRFEANSFWTDGPMSEGEIEDARMKCQYVLSGVLVHRGRAGGGHYYSFKHVSPESIAERIDEGHVAGASLFNHPKQGWFRFDDNKVMPFDPSSSHSGLDPECFGGSIERTSTTNWGTVRTEKVEREWSAFMLLYERVEETFEKPVGMASNPGSDLPFSPMLRRSSMLSSTPHSPVLSSLLSASRTSRRRVIRRIKRHKSSEADRNKRFPLGDLVSPQTAGAAAGGGSVRTFRVARSSGRIGSSGKPQVIPQSLKESTLSGLIVQHRDWVSRRFNALLNEEVRMSNQAYARQAVLFDHLVLAMALRQLQIAQDSSIQEPDLSMAGRHFDSSADVLAASLEEEAEDHGSDDIADAYNVRESISESCLRVFQHVALRTKHASEADLEQWVLALVRSIKEHPRLAALVIRELADEQAVYLDDSMTRTMVKDMEDAINQLSRLQQYSGALQQVGYPLLAMRGVRAQLLDCAHRPSFLATLSLIKTSLEVIFDQGANEEPKKRTSRLSLIQNFLEKLLDEAPHAAKHANTLERYGEVWVEIASIGHDDLLECGSTLNVPAHLIHLSLGVRSPADKAPDGSDLPSIGIPEGSAVPNITPLIKATRFFAKSSSLAPLSRFMLGSEAFLASVFTLYSTGEEGMQQLIESHVERRLFEPSLVLRRGLVEIRENAGFCQYASSTSSGERPKRAHSAYNLLCKMASTTETNEDLLEYTRIICEAPLAEFKKTTSGSSGTNGQEEEDFIQIHAKGIVAGQSAFGVSQYLVFVIAVFIEILDQNSSFASAWLSENLEIWEPLSRWLKLVSPPHSKGYIQGFSEGFVDTLVRKMADLRQEHLTDMDQIEDEGTPTESSTSDKDEVKSNAESTSN